MASKIKIYTVTAPFTHAKHPYAPGDEFALPAGWVLDEEYMENAAGGRVTFSEPYTQTYIENGEKKTDTFYRRVLLPVKDA